VEFCHKWYEAIGQSLYYAARTRRRAGIVLICKDRERDETLAKLQEVVTRYQLPLDVLDVIPEK
jgi:hypothetical protein